MRGLKNRSERHQVGVSALVARMMSDGVRVHGVDHEDYFVGPEVINSRVPDVTGRSPSIADPFMAVGEVEFLEDLMAEFTERQLRHFTEWAQRQPIPVQLYLGLIRDRRGGQAPPRHDGFSKMIADEDRELVLLDLRSAGWIIVEV